MQRKSLGISVAVLSKKAGQLVSRLVHPVRGDGGQAVHIDDQPLRFDLDLGGFPVAPVPSAAHHFAGGVIEVD
jgi:hypothetical protein